jgi:hypothetical protein
LTFKHHQAVPQPKRALAAFGATLRRRPAETRWPDFRARLRAAWREE